MKQTVKIDENYYLVSQKVEKEKTVNVPQNVNHIFVVDVSGSMYHDLPLIRTQLKNKLSNLMKMGDTISIVWFSGRNDAGILKEEVEVKSLKTLSDLNDAIDRWLKPIGLTAFLKPLQLVEDLVKRLKANRPSSINSLIFLSDGYNNDCPFTDVMTTLKVLEPVISSSLFVEYGYYADSRRLTEMASAVGGEKISCNGFDEFEPLFETKISQNLMGGKKIEVKIENPSLYDFVYTVSNDSIVQYAIADEKVMVSPDVDEVYYFSSQGIGDSLLTHSLPLYAGIYVLSDRLKNDEAEKIFYQLGDNYYYKMLVNAFGKQKLNAFKSAIKECVINEAKRFPEGKTSIAKVDDNAYCLMNLINDLSDMENCLFYPSHPSFTYNRIGRKKVAIGSNLTDADKQRLAEAKDVEEASKILKELEEKKIDIKFVNTDPERGYKLTDLVWNESRANLSIRIKIDGKAILPKNKYGIDEIVTYKYNTFTLIKDGIVNVEDLPINYSDELYTLLMKNGVKFTINNEKYDAKLSDTTFGRTIVINLTSIPLINRGMVKSISANELAKQEWELQKLQGDKKVYDFFRKSLFPKTSESFTEMLGEECSNWLKEIGITDYNGFAPKTESEESTDFYMSVELLTKIKGLSSLPKVDDVIKKMAENKPLKINEWVLSNAIKKYQEQLNSDIYKSLPDDLKKETLKTYIITKSNEVNCQKRKAMQRIAEIKFSMILSKRWFSEFKSFDENTLSLKLDDNDLVFTFDLTEKEVKI